jgi:hypothetical protein
VALEDRVGDFEIVPVPVVEGQAGERAEIFLEEAQMRVIEGDDLKS